MRYQLPVWEALLIGLPLQAGALIRLICRSSRYAITISDTPFSIGCVYGPKFSIWDISRLRGGKPLITGSSFSEGGQHFRCVLQLYNGVSCLPFYSWCHTYPEHFAISTQSPSKGAIVQVYNVNFIQAQPTIFNLRPRPHFVRDFDFLAMRGIPRIAAAVGHTVMIFSIGVDS